MEWMVSMERLWSFLWWWSYDEISRLSTFWIRFNIYFLANTLHISFQLTVWKKKSVLPLDLFVSADINNDTCECHGLTYQTAECNTYPCPVSEYPDVPIGEGIHVLPVDTELGQKEEKSNILEIPNITHKISTPKCQWSEWSSCGGSACDNGFAKRSRQVFFPE